jgi:hypothetical protein
LLDTAEGRQMKGHLADEAERLRQRRGAGERGGRIGEAVLGIGDGAEHRLGVHQPAASFKA